MATAIARVVEAMKRIAPLHLAEKWDNVGLIVDVARGVARAGGGGAAAGAPPQVFLTNDLTERVLAEALSLDPQPDIIVTYHPTPFRSFKKLGNGDPTGRIVLDLVRRGVAVYSPHTALDSVAGGVNDWLASGMGKGTVTAVQPADAPADAAGGADDAPVQGQGRVVALDEPVPLTELVARVKAHLGLDHVRVADAGLRGGGDEGGGEGGDGLRLVRTVALCAGAGASVLRGCAADVWLTGEMSHHEVLGAVHAGTAVVLTEHSNCERGYLPVLSGKLLTELGGPDAATITVSAVDEDPLRVV